MPPPPAPVDVPQPKVAAEQVTTEAPHAETTRTMDDDRCASDTLCALSGFCTSEGDECVAASDEDCAASRQCLSDGACIANEDVCVAGRDEHCQQSEACKREGRCRAKDGYCSA